ncbi:MAG: PD40 domain-containing protein [Anaerolineae bacterium]|nr:PD40 domain-containing protein [Anaerolineae bacterium]
MGRWMRCLGLLAWIIGILWISVAASPAAAQSAAGTAKIVFVIQDYDTRTMTLNMANPDGSGVVTLVEGGFFSYPAWSPDGRQLAFIGAVREFDDTNLFVMNSDGTNLHAVFSPPPNGPDPSYAAWSPDGTQFIFGWENAARDIEIFIMRADGSERERMRFTGIPGYIQGLPGELASDWAAWSADGSTIAVQAWLPDNLQANPDDRFRIYVSSLDGSAATAYPATRSGDIAFDRLAWSPDGQHAVLQAYPGYSTGFQELAVASADGTTIETLITPPPNSMFSASWSPDSSQIVFIANEPNVETFPRGALYVMNADGSNLHALTVDADIANRGTAWGVIPADVVLPTAPILLDSAG